MSDLPRILLVDDEPSVLASYTRSLHGKFDVVTAVGAQAGLEALERAGPFAVVVSDLRMPEQSGIEFLAQVRERAPTTVRMLLTGCAEVQSAIEAINEGRVFRFLTKPCPPETLIKVIHAGVDQYELVTAERDLLERTLSGSVKLLTDVLAVANPPAFGRATRLSRLVRSMGAQLGSGPSWQTELAARLSQLGCIAIPDGIMLRASRGEPLAPHEEQMLAAHPALGSNLVANIPRLDEVARIILYQGKRYDGGGYPKDEVAGVAIPLGARLLHVALAYDASLQSGKLQHAAVIELRRDPGCFDPLVLSALERAVEREAGYSLRRMAIDELRPGMLINEDVVSVGGGLLVSRGQEVNAALIAKLKRHPDLTGPGRLLQVLTPVGTEHAAPGPGSP